MPRLLLPAFGTTYLGMLAALLNAGFRVALVPLLITPLFDRVILQQDFASLSTLLLLGFVLITTGSLMLLAQDGLLGLSGVRVTALWREGLLSALLGRQPGRLPGTSGGLMGRILNDLKDIELYLQYGLGTLVAESLTLLGIVLVLFSYNAVATLYLLMAAIPLALGLSWLGRRLERFTLRSQEMQEQVGSRLQEGFRHHILIRAFLADAFILRRFAPFNKALQGKMQGRILLAALQTPVAQILIFVAVGLLLMVLTRSVASGNMSPGELVGYITLMALLATPAQLLPRGLALWQQARAASSRLKDLLVPDKTETVSEPLTSEHPGLELRSLHVNYGETSVLQGISLRLPERGLVAVTGDSGAGKTTLLMLLLRFVRPSSGQLFWRGKNIVSYPERQWRELLAYVPQDSALLSGSLRENLCLTEVYADEKIWSVLRLVHLEATLRQLPGQLEYQLSEDGGGLSGGQQQRVAVARALLRDPEILLLDEPSANLDAESEGILASSLRDLANGRLVLVVAHRPALLRMADLVVTLKDGQVVHDLSTS